MTNKTLNSDKVRTMVLEDITADVNGFYEAAVEAGEIKEVRPPSLVVEQDGNTLTVKTSKMTLAQRHVALGNIDADIRRIREEQETTFPNEIPQTFTKGKVRTGKEHFAESHSVLKLTKVYVPEEEQEASKRRITETLCTYAESCHALKKDYGSVFSLQYQDIMSEEWETLQDFREQGHNAHHYVQATEKFHKCLELVDQLIDQKCAGSALEILAVMRRINNDEEASAHLEGNFNYHLYHAGKRIYAEFLDNPEEFQNLTPWQYEALVDSATQYELDKVEDASSYREKDDEIANLARNGEQLEESSRRAEQTRKLKEARMLKEARQGIFNCIASHYMVKKREEVSKESVLSV